MDVAVVLDDAFHHIQSRAYLACDVIGDPASSLEDIDMARRALEDLARQIAAIRWSHTGYGELYEEVGHMRVAALKQMTRIA